MDEAVRLLSQAAMLLAPSRTEQEAFSSMLNSMEPYGATARQKVLALIDGMSDGLKYGNWPRTD